VNINLVADEVLAYLATKHTRVYRNKAPKSPVFPYIIYKVESVVNTMPSEDLYVNIDIYEDVNKAVRGMEDLADLIDGNGNQAQPSGLNQRIINTDKLNLYFDREQRQYITPDELVTTHLINLRYVVRAYFK